MRFLSAPQESIYLDDISTETENLSRIRILPPRPVTKRVLKPKVRIKLNGSEEKPRMAFVPPRSQPHELKQVGLETATEVSERRQRRSNLEPRRQFRSPGERIRAQHDPTKRRPTKESHLGRDQTADDTSEAREGTVDCKDSPRQQEDEHRYRYNLANPSPGEGLRNALSNLEKRFDRGRRAPPEFENRHERLYKSSDGKGVASLVEEMLHTSLERSDKGSTSHIGL